MHSSLTTLCAAIGEDSSKAATAAVTRASVLDVVCYKADLNRLELRQGEWSFAGMATLLLHSYVVEEKRLPHPHEWLVCSEEVTAWDVATFCDRMEAYPMYRYSVIGAQYLRRAARLQLEGFYCDEGSHPTRASAVCVLWGPCVVAGVQWNDGGDSARTGRAAGGNACAFPSLLRCPTVAT